MRNRQYDEETFDVINIKKDNSMKKKLSVACFYSTEIITVYLLFGLRSAASYKRIEGFEAGLLYSWPFKYSKTEFVKI